MFTTKIFIKKNKIGNYLKNVREHYIRDDISCGVNNCKKCTRTESNLTLNFKNKCALLKYNHYLILDTNVILDQIDVLEEPIIGNVIILHTVLKEVKHRSFTTYKRLDTIIENPNRHFYIFINDHHKDTYLTQKDAETANDYNDRSIRKACLWYAKHLPKEKFIFLTDDAENRNLAESEGIKSYSVYEYIRNLDDKTLEDKLSRKDFHTDSDNVDVYPNHLTNLEILKGIKDGQLLQATFKASKENFLEGYVNVDSYVEPILIQGRSSLNRAVDGDTVAIELLDKNEWVSPSDIMLEDEGNDDVNMELGGNDLKNDKIKPTGKIVGIIRRKWRQYCGIIQGDNDGIYQLFIPADKCIPKIRIETRQADYLRSQKIVVTIDSWPRNSRYPHGHFVRALGKIGDQSTENEVILLEHDVPHSHFSEEVLNCLPKLPWIITEDDLKKRVDLRHLNICSVDPPGCTDIDDALHCRVLDNGKYEVGVHIADVTHFIRPGTALDMEAASRGTTVYLVNKRIDMVPELLSSNLCSLRGGEERFAFSCIWKLDKNANILNTKFHKSIIKSRQAMTYEEAQLMIDDKNKKNEIAQSLRNLNILAKILKKKRLNNGALVLASPEVKVMMDSETMEPLNVEMKKLFETNSMVEEFMLLANISVAEKILEEFPDCAMLRRHPIPPITNFDPLVKAGRHLGFDIKVDNGKNLARSLDDAENPNNPYLNTMLRILATRCMLQAVYFVSGLYQKNEYFHYGLAIPLYTHFTSPIRRYADIIVHRLLAICCNADSTYSELLDKQKTNQLCQNLNYRNRMAQYAGRASIAFNTHLFFKQKIQDEEGYILQIRKNAIQILIPRYGLECTLFLTKKGETSNIFVYNEEEQTQTAGKIILHTFDPVKVRLHLDSNNIQHEKLILELIEPYIDGFSIKSIDLNENKRKSISPDRRRKKGKKKLSE